MGQQPVVVIPFVRDHFRDGRVAPALDQRRLRHHQSLRASLAVAPVGAGYRRRHDGLGGQVHRVLGLVGQMRGAVLHLRDASVGVVRVFPVFVGHLLARPGAVEALQIGSGWVVDPFGLGQRAQIGLPVGARVLAHDALPDGIGCQRGGVHAHGGSPQQARRLQLAQHLVKHRVEHRLRQTLADEGQRGVDRRGLGERDAEELPQRETVGAPPGDAALAVQPLKITDEEHAEVGARGNPDAATSLVVRSAQVFDERIKLGLGEHGIEPGVEGMAGTAGQFCRRDEKFLLPWFTSSQCHAHRGRAGCFTRYARARFLTGC